MSDASSRPPESQEALTRAVESLKVFCGMVLLSLAKHGSGDRDTTIRNFLARGMVCTESILLVWRAGSEQDAWILHRSLLDRLFHLHHLAKHDGFRAFEEFSFMRLYEARDRLLSDTDMRSKVPKSLRSVQAGHRARYRQLSSAGSPWRRPKAEQVAKDMGLGFLYRHGYDYASTHVHPMASDGETDCDRLASLPDRTPAPDETVVRNSILVCAMLIQIGLNASSMRWRAIVYDLLDQVRRFAGDGNRDFELTLGRIASVWPAFELCQPAQDGGS